MIIFFFDFLRNNRSGFFFFFFQKNIYLEYKNKEGEKGSTQVSRVYTFCFHIYCNAIYNCHLQFVTLYQLSNKSLVSTQSLVMIT